MLCQLLEKGEACECGGPLSNMGSNKNGIYPMSEFENKDERITPSKLAITLTSAVYKVLSCVQFNHISQWAESDSITADEQNGFRKKLVGILTLSKNTDSRKNKAIYLFPSVLEHWITLTKSFFGIKWFYLSYNKMLNVCICSLI